MTKNKTGAWVENVRVQANTRGGEEVLERGKQDADLKQIYAV
jgi:hypothetical protein